MPVKISTPGRLCLFGEHCDWSSEYGIHKGFCIVTGTDQALAAEVGTSDRFVVETRMPDELGRPSGLTRQMSCLWKPQTILKAAKDETEFFRYCAGVAYQIMTKWKIDNGIDIRINKMDLPLKKGVSSSAAVCILVAKAFDAVYDLRLFPHELMELAYLGEKITGSQCGRMDQACIYGKTPVLLVFEKSKAVQVEPVFAGKDIYMFFVDLAGQKDTVKILSDLQNQYLRSTDLQNALGQINEQITRLAYQALLKGDAAGLGELMTRAQQNFDSYVAPHSPTQLKSPLLHQLLDFEKIKEHIHGGKGVGSQGDGTAQFVARSSRDRDEAIRKIKSEYPQMQCFPLTIHSSASNR